jgi:hypothetical protein
LKLQETQCWDGGVAQVVECLPSKYEVLSSNPNAEKKKKTHNAKRFVGTRQYRGLSHKRRELQFLLLHFTIANILNFRTLEPLWIYTISSFQ